MILTDLYLPAGAELPRGELPGLQSLARFAERRALPDGWRPWLAQRAGRPDLAALPVARIAAAVLAWPAAAAWIASPLHLSAGLSRVHLDPRGLLRLPARAQGLLSERFGRDFGTSDFRLSPLASGEFLLEAPGVEVVATLEPARVAGAELAAALPQGSAAAGLRRTAAEIEMWLHAQAASLAPEAGVNALWLWGANGAAGEVARHAAAVELAAFGADAYLDGLWHLCGARARALPPALAPVLGERAEAAVLALRVADVLQESWQLAFLEAVRMLDERYLQPALAALRARELGRLTLIGNDRVLSATRRSLWRLWRARPAGLAGLA